MKKTIFIFCLVGKKITWKEFSILSRDSGWDEVDIFPSECKFVYYIHSGKKPKESNRNKKT
jgi:hypothetical protein